jgi:hypothetical protein
MYIINLKKNKLFEYTEYQAKVLNRTNKHLTKNRYVINLNEDYI